MALKSVRRGGDYPLQTFADKLALEQSFSTSYLSLTLSIALVTVNFVRDMIQTLTNSEQCE